jgi:hypothetical protein
VVGPGGLGWSMEYCRAAAAPVDGGLLMQSSLVRSLVVPLYFFDVIVRSGACCLRHIRVGLWRHLHSGAFFFV